MRIRFFLLLFCFDACADRPHALHHPRAQIGDIQALFQRETAGTKLHGVTAGELATVALVRAPPCTAAAAASRWHSAR